MVVTLNPESSSAGMLSLPRDMLVHASLLDRDVKINTLHVLGEINKYPGGGPMLLSQTVSELLGYPIDFYVRLNFDGFRHIIDLIGGVDIDVANEIRDDKYPDNNYGYDPLYIPAGRQHMGGDLALKYARTRHGDNDYERAARQQQVILAVKDKIMQPGQLASLLPRHTGVGAGTRYNRADQHAHRQGVGPCPQSGPGRPAEPDARCRRSDHGPDYLR